MLCGLLDLYWRIHYCNYESRFLLNVGMYKPATRRHNALHCHHRGSHQHRMTYRYFIKKYQRDILRGEGHYEGLHRGLAAPSMKRFGRQPNYKSTTWNTKEMEDNIKIVFTEFVRMGYWSRTADLLRVSGVKRSVRGCGNDETNQSWSMLT